MNEQDENVLTTGNNIMFDARVVRGNTYAAQVVTQNQQRQQGVFTRKMGENQGNGQQDDYRPGTPPPVMGRSHMDVQTEVSLLFGESAGWWWVGGVYAILFTRELLRGGWCGFGFTPPAFPPFPSRLPPHIMV